MKPTIALNMIALGLALLFAGFLVPFLMVLQVLEAGFALSFLAHFSSLSGLVVALYGALHYVGSRGVK
jgi:hypothetical protein